MSANAAFKLQDAGFTRQQVEALGEFMDTQAASEADLGEAKAELKADIAETKAELKADIAPLKAEMLVMKWMIGFVLAFQIAIFVRTFIH